MDGFDQLCRQCSPMVYRYLMSLGCSASLAEELTAETFYRAFLHIGQFHGECKIESWLCAIAKNIWFKERKKSGRFVSLDTLAEAADPEDRIERVHDREQVRIALKLLHTLKGPYKEVFTLRILGDLKFREIAEIFGKTESWAKVTFYRAKEKIIERMEREYEN